VNDQESGKPHFVLCYTDTAQGIPLLEERKPKLHYVRFKSEEEMAHYQTFLDEMIFEMEVA
ncbi:MAG: transketolase, partial [Anaerolineae bacterium]